MFISSPISYTLGMLGGLIMDRWCAPEQLPISSFCCTHCKVIQDIYWTECNAPQLSGEETTLWEQQQSPANLNHGGYGNIY